MGQVHKLLGRSTPAAATNTLLYTAPVGTTTIITSIHVSNHSGANDTMRIFLVPSGGGTGGTTNDIYYDVVVQPGNPPLINGVEVLMTGDAIYVYSLNGNLTFTASGIEIS